MTSHPGKTIQAYNLSVIILETLVLPVTPRNIMSAFRSAGIWPFNIDIFTDEDLCVLLLLTGQTQTRSKNSST